MARCQLGAPGRGERRRVPNGFTAAWRGLVHVRPSEPGWVPADGSGKADIRRFLTFRDGSGKHQSRCDGPHGEVTLIALSFSGMV